MPTLKQQVAELQRQIAALQAKPKQKVWLTVAEVKQEYGFERGSIYQLVSKGVVSSRKAAGLQILKSSLERYVNRTAVFVSPEDKRIAINN